MDIVTFYVGQGAFGLVRCGQDAVFVDAFMPSGDDRRQEDLQLMLERLLRDRVTAGLVLTGFDADHCSASGVEFILSTYRPRWIMYPKYYKDTNSAAEAFEVIDQHESRRRLSAHPLRRVSVRVDRADGRVLSGLASEFELELFSPHFEDMDNSNNSSIVLKLTGKGASGFSYLITGDTENERWERISTIFGESIRADVLAAPHHGSKNATNARALMLIRPNTVLISAGVDNTYGHPHAQAVAAYGRVAKHVYATNVEGGVSLFTRAVGPDFDTRLVR